MSSVGWEILESSGKFICRKDTYAEAGRFLVRCDPRGSLGFRLAEAKEVSVEACRQYHGQRLQVYDEGRIAMILALSEIAGACGTTSVRYAELAEALRRYDEQYSDCAHTNSP